MKKNKFAIIGLGNFGWHLARVLDRRKKELLVVDRSRNKINLCKKWADRAVETDATKAENLKALGLDDYDQIIICTGPRLESSILIFHLLRNNLEIGVDKITAKANSVDHQQILEAVGAKDVVYPERDMAENYAGTCSSRKIFQTLIMESGLVIQEIAPPEPFNGKSIKEIGIRNRYGINVIAIRSVVPDQLIQVPHPDFVIKDSDKLIIGGEKKIIESFNAKFS